MKKLVLFSDGTGNSSAKAQKTNVWRMFEALDQTTPDQLAKYDDGVGTSPNKYLAALGGAFGYGLKRNVIDLYKFVCRNYKPDDQIFGFGFSRGAFTIRVVVGLIATQGLVTGSSESELHANAVIAYRQYRSDRFKSWSPFVLVGRFLRDFILMPWSAIALKGHRETRPRGEKSIPIEFLGLWDTVDAYGMPVDELKWGLNLLVWPMTSVDHHLYHCVKRACHALALDEQRQTFTPTLFDEAWEAQEVKAGRVPPDRLTQVWFTGVHSNVGGGYPEDRLSFVSFDWMASQAQAAGLRFEPGALATIANDRSAYARLYDSRAGVMSYYRYRPRQIAMGSYPQDGAGPAEEIKPIIHGSVVMRLAVGSDAYAPISLPADFDVLSPDGRLIPMQGFPYEDPTLAMRLDRPIATTASPEVRADRVEALDAAISELKAPGRRPDAEMVDQVRDTVWWRRVAYFGTLFATLMLLAFPFAWKAYAAIVLKLLGWIPGIGEGLAGDVRDAVQKTDSYSQGPVGQFVDVVAPLAPHYLGRWLDALSKEPVEMIAALALVAIPFFAGRLLGSRVHDRAWYAWHGDQRAHYLDWIQKSFRRSLLLAGTGFAIFAILASLARHFAWRLDVQVSMLFLAIAFALAVLWRAALLISARLRKSKVDASKPLPITPTLWIARKLRTTTWLTRTWAFLADRVVPILFALAVLLAGGCLVYHAICIAEETTGGLCSGHEAAALAPDAAGKWKVGGFQTSDMCWSSGIHVKAGVQYTATLEMGDPWFDHLGRTDLAGFAVGGSRHVLAAALKRDWAVNWFAPILKVGRAGADEFPMISQCQSKERCEPVGYEEVTGIVLDDFKPLLQADAQRIAGLDTQAGRRATRATVIFTPHFDGELLLYVNDAIGFPREKRGRFYENNAGSATLEVAPVGEPVVEPKK